MGNYTWMHGMGYYTTFVAFLLILDGLDESSERDEYDIVLIEYDLDIAAEMYLNRRYADTPVYSTITV